MLRKAAIRFVELTGLVIVLHFLAYGGLKLFTLAKSRNLDEAQLGDWRFLLWFVVAAGLLIYLKIITKRGDDDSSNDQGAA